MKENLPPGSERRQYRRIRKPYSVNLCVQDAAAKPVWDMVFTKDISAGGMLFIHETEIPVGTRVDLKINFALNQPPIICSGRVLRCLAKGRPAVYEIAVFFSMLNKSEGDLIEKNAEKFYEH